MVTFDPILMAFLKRSESCYERDIQAVLAARRLYDHVYSRGQLSRLWRLMTRRSRHLLNLTSLETTSHLQTYHYLGIQMVPIKQIWGSEGRSHDFDALFYPRQRHSQERWLSVATARMMALTLPPVGLIQVGEGYFVRDGHHRISVARALGEQHIEAEVTVRQVSRPLAGKWPVSPTSLQSPAISALITAGNLDQRCHRPFDDLAAADCNPFRNSLKG
jgi:hypothetical protein